MDRKKIVEGLRQACEQLGKIEEALLEAVDEAETGEDFTEIGRRLYGLRKMVDTVDRPLYKSLKYVAESQHKECEAKEYEDFQRARAAVGKLLPSPDPEDDL